MKQFFPLLFVSSSLLLIGACSPIGMAVGLGAAGATAIAQERDISDTATDTRIRFELNDLWFKHSMEMHHKLNMSVNEGRVLITGAVPDPQMRVDAVRLAWQVEGVTEVINEIEIADSADFVGSARDKLIQTELRAKLTLDSDIESINYSIDVSRGVVYLMGIAQSREELDRVLDYARYQNHVRRVVSYVRIKEPEPIDTSDKD